MVLAEIVINVLLGAFFVVAMALGILVDRRSRQYQHAEPLANYVWRNQSHSRSTQPNQAHQRDEHLIEPLSIDEWIELVTSFPHQTYVKCHHKHVAVTVQYPANRSLSLDWTSIVAFLEALNANVTTDAESLSWSYDRQTLKTADKITRSNQHILLQVMLAVQKSAVNYGVKK